MSSSSSGSEGSHNSIDSEINYHKVEIDPFKQPRIESNTTSDNSDLEDEPLADLEWTATYEKEVKANEE